MDSRLITSIRTLAPLPCIATLTALLFATTAAAHGVAEDDAQFLEKISG